MTYAATETGTNGQSRFQTTFQKIFREPANGPTIAAAGLSVVSLITTIAGFGLLFGGNWVLAIASGAAFQYLLFLTSMRLGRIVNGMGVGIGANLSMFVFYCLALVASSGFSAIFIWDQVLQGEQQEQAFLNAVQNSVAGEVERMSEDRVTQEGVLLKTVRNQVDKWEPIFVTLAEVGKNTQTSFEVTIKAEIADKEDALEAAESERQDAEDRLKDGAADSATAGTRIAELTSRITPLEQEIQTLQQSRTLFEARKQEAVIRLNRTLSGDDGTAPKCGPICDGAKRERDEAQGHIDDLNADIQTKTTALGELKGEIARLELAGNQTDTGAGLEQEIAAIDKQIKAIRGEIAGLRIRLANRVGDGAATGTNPLSRLRNAPTSEAYTAALAECTEDLNLFRRPESQVADQVTGLSCDSRNLQVAIERYESFVTGTAEFEQTCGLQSADLTTISSKTRDGALSYGQSCLTLADLPRSKSDLYRQTFSNLDRQQNADAFLFNRATDAFWRGEPTLVTAGVMALVIDAFIFVFAWFNALDGRDSQRKERIRMNYKPQPGDPQNIMFIKALLGLLTTRTNPDRRTRMYTSETDYTVLQSRLKVGGNQAVFEGIFRREIRDHGKIVQEGPREVLMVKDEFIDFFENILREHQAQTQSASNAGFGSAAAGTPLIGQDDNGDPIGRAPKMIEQVDRTQGRSVFGDEDVEDAYELDEDEYEKEEDPDTSSGPRDTAKSFLKS